MNLSELGKFCLQIIQQDKSVLLRKSKSVLFPDDNFRN
jgi:hypothetical protein